VVPEFDVHDVNIKALATATHRRPYRMVARAQAAANTSERVMAAADQLFGRLPYDQVTLQAIADEGAVTVQTVMRRFGSKESLFVKVGEARGRLIRATRDQVRVGDAKGAVRDVLKSYELWGDVIMHQLGQEPRVPEVRRGVEKGRRYHQAWVRRIFEPLLSRLSRGERQLRLAQLVVATDLYSWKILRRDLGLDRLTVERCMAQMVIAILGSHRSARQLPAGR
jgi:AcrR family transcriptional regulator